jgi:hypothetical protein
VKVGAFACLLQAITRKVSQDTLEPIERGAFRPLGALLCSVLADKTSER